MLEGANNRVALSATFLFLGAFANIIFSLCLGHTWKKWRQVKWYVLMLLVGNWMEVLFVFLVRLVQAQNWQGTAITCNFVMFMASLARTLAAMAVAAMSVHTLMTAVTGCQGYRLRHTLLIGLFALLSLPFPIFRLVTSRLERADEVTFCVGNDIFAFFVGMGINFFLFPFLVILCVQIAAAVVRRVKSNDKRTGEENSSDSVISGLLGWILLVTCLPFFLTLVFTYHLDIFLGMLYLQSSRNILSAIAVVVFAFATMQRVRKNAPPMDPIEMDERRSHTDGTAVS